MARGVEGAVVDTSLAPDTGLSPSASQCGPSRTKERLNTWWPTRNTITKSAILRNRGCDRIGQAYPLRALGGQLDWEKRHAKATYVESQKSRVSQPDPLCSIDSNARQTQPMRPNINMRSGSSDQGKGCVHSPVAVLMHWCTTSIPLQRIPMQCDVPAPVTSVCGRRLPRTQNGKPRTKKRLTVTRVCSRLGCGLLGIGQYRIADAQRPNVAKVCWPDVIDVQ